MSSPPGAVGSSFSPPTTASSHATVNPPRKSLRERLPSSRTSAQIPIEADAPPSTSTPPTRPLTSLESLMSTPTSVLTSPVQAHARQSITTGSASSTPINRPPDSTSPTPAPVPAPLLLPSPSAPSASFQPHSPSAGSRKPLGPPSPRNSEEAVNWQRRMQKIETTSARRTSFIARQTSGAAATSRSLKRAHSFSNASVAAAAARGEGAGSFDAPTPVSASYLASPTLSKGATAQGKAGGARRHHRSMSNVVDWTPYNRRKNKPTSIPPFSPTKSSLPSFVEPSLTQRSTTTPPTPRKSVSAAAPQTPPTLYQRYLHSLYALRMHWLSQSFRRFTHTTVYFSLCIVCTLFSLYAEDVSVCWFPPSADLPISVLLTCCLALFSLDILACSVVRTGYFLSFFFFLDVVGTLSLILDIQFMLPLNLNSIHDGSSSQRLNQSGNVLRITRFVRLFRVMQVLRVVKLFKFHAEVEEAVVAGEKVGHTANKVGLKLAELIDKRVISMLLGLIIILPFFTVDDSNYGQSQQVGLDILETLVLTHSPSPSTVNDTQDFLSKYESYHSTLLYLSFPTSPPYTPVSLDTSSLRSRDIDTFLAPQGSVALFDLSSQYYTTSLYSIILTSIIIAMFMAGSVLISKDVYQLVVAPLERMTSIIKKLAGTICFLTHDEEEGKALESADGEEKPSNETRVIEGIIEKLATIFQVQPDATMQGPKALQRMAGSKHTEITTNTSVVSIAVVERPRVDLQDVEEDEPGGGGVGAEVDTSRHKELRSVEEGMAHAAVLPHFRLYLTTNLLMENLLFYQEVERFKAILTSHSLSLYANFISASSSSQVNISAALHDRVKEGVATPRATMFDEAQAECIGLMKAHVRGFVESKYAQLYLKKKGRQPGAEVMYRKKRGGGAGMARAAEDAKQGSAYAPSQRSSITLQRAKIEEAEEEDDEASAMKVHISPVVAVAQPTALATPVLSIVQKRPSKSPAAVQAAPARVANLRADDLQAEIAALEFPGAESAALFNPTAKKRGEGTTAVSAAATAQAKPATVGREMKRTKAEVREENKEAEVEAKAGGDVRVTEVEPMSAALDEAVKAVDSEVEEEVARLLVEDSVRSSSLSANTQ